MKNGVFLIIGIFIGSLIALFGLYWLNKQSFDTINSYNFLLNVIVGIATILIFFTALWPIAQKARLGKNLFENAIVVDIQPDGVFRIFNIFTDTVTIDSVQHVLIKGGELELEKTSKSEDIAEKLKNFIKNYFNRVNNLNKWEEITLLRKDLPPGIHFVLAGTKTHLPKALEAGALWIVITKIIYRSTSGIKREKQYIHRFSIALEPRLRWVEVL